MDRERISRLEALLARVKARGDEPRASTVGESPADGEMILSSDDLESLPPPPMPKAPDVSVPTRPAFAPVPVEDAEKGWSEPPLAAPEPAFVAAEHPASLEEAFEQYELEAEANGEVMEIAPDAEDDSARISVRPPVMIDAEFDAVAKIEAQQGEPSAEATIADELQSQRRLVAAAPFSEENGVDSGELEIVGEADLEADLEEEVMEADTDDLIEQSGSLEERVAASLDELGAPSNRPTREMSAILESGFDAPPEHPNRPVLELQESQDEIEEPPPSSRRPVSHEEVREAELTFENDVPPPPMTPPPESGPQEALPIHADLRPTPAIADVIPPHATLPATFGELLEDALTL